MNKVIMMGRLTRDPDIRYTPDNMAIARFALAVDRRFKTEGQKEADFFNCTAFAKTAEFCEKYLSKGSKVLLIGRLQNDTYTNRDGQKVYSVQILVEELEFGESKSETEKQKPADDFVAVPEDVTEEELPFI